MPRRRRSVHAFALLVATICWLPPVDGTAAEPLDQLGAARIPQDAAFLSSSLRLREQADRILDSRAFKAACELPLVKRAVEAFEEQRSLPGNPLALASVFLELPENKQAVEVLADLVSNDSFVYGGPSCVALADLFRKLQTANQVAGVVGMVASGPRGIGSTRFGPIFFDFDREEDEDVPPDVLLVLEAEEEEGEGEEEKEDDKDDTDKDDTDKDDTDKDDTDKDDTDKDDTDRDDTEEDGDDRAEVAAEELSARMFIDTLEENVDQIVVPEIVWGFKVGKKDAATTQLARLEGLLKLLVTAVPQLANSLDRENVAGHEFVTLTVSGDGVPWDDLDLGRLAERSRDFEKVIERLRKLRLVVAIGIIDDTVILSIGDSLEQVEKFAATTAAKGLLSTAAFKPLADAAGAKLTGIAYVSEPLSRAVAPSVDHLRQLAGMSGRLAKSAGVPDASDEVRALITKIADDSEKRLPVPGPWMAYSLMGEKGYEGSSWDWSRNVPVDGSKPLSLLGHAGGTPLAAAVIRAKNDPSQFDEIVSWIDGGRRIFEKSLKEDDRREFVDFVKAFGPLVSKLAEIVRGRFLPSLADGQIGFVLDAKPRTKQLHDGMPAATEPLPLPEAAIVLGVTDPKQFQEGLNDLFDLADEFLDTMRRFSPKSVPEGYRIPDPERTQVETGTIWSFAIPSSGLDEQIRPSIAIGADAVAIAIVPKHAERLLAKKRFETAAEAMDFDGPLAAAAALDNAGLIAAIEPWVFHALEVIPFNGVAARDREEDGALAAKHTRLVLDVLACLRSAAAKTTVEGEARVTRWRNVIRDLPEAAEKR